MERVVVRFAPSPTGFLHIGGARTAIFNYLFARHHGGKFLLRIEDTDRERSKQEYEDDILDALRWLGIEWDEPPVRQSVRLSFHREAVEELVERGAAYRCFLTVDEAQKIKDEIMRQGGLVAFRSPDRYLDPKVAIDRAEKGETYAVRFRAPDETLEFRDTVHGIVRVEPETLDDFVIMRQDGTPTYQVAVVADDYEMGVTHVIRGDDHLSNTPKQILIYQALGWKPPEFTHVPLILGSDKKRLSKRHGATALSEYRNKGYLPEALLSFLALLGWSIGDDREILTKQELIASFNLEGLNKKSAIFDEQKLEWMNGEFITRKPDLELAALLRQPFAERVASGKFPAGSAKNLPLAISMLKSRCRFPEEILNRGFYFFTDPQAVDPVAAKKRLKNPATPERLGKLAAIFEKLGDNFNIETTENAVRQLSEELDINSGELIHPVRLAVSGQAVGPGLFELLTALGRETVVRRMRWLETVLREHSTGVPPVEE